jgi:putative oxidoreductase
MKWFAYGPAVLRLALAAVFAAHGAQKLFGVWGGGGLHETARYFTAAGIDRPLFVAFEAVKLDPALAATFLAGLVGVVEFGGGLLLLPGLLTRWAAAALAIEMAVAAYLVHLKNGFFLNWTVAPGVGHGVEMNLVLVGGLICLLFTGAGALSIDTWRQESREEAALGRARLRAKVDHH